MQSIEVLADQIRIKQHRAVIANQHGHFAEWIECEHFLVAAGWAGFVVDDLEGAVQAHFMGCYEHFAGVGGMGLVQQFHGRHDKVELRGDAAPISSNAGKLPGPAEVQGEMPPVIDDVDKKILRVIQQDARRSAESIGTDIGLSASAVQRRIARLRDDGVITAEVAIVDPKSVGRALTMIVDVEVERERPELMAVLKRWIAGEPAIQEAWYVTGDGDFVLIVCMRDVEEYDALMQKLVTENPNVRRFRTRVALGTLKRGCAVPIDSAD
jgi:DNA-binding Lrp family transcriptional regulator